MKEFDKILDKKEEIFWEGNPKFWPFIFSASIGTTIFGIIILIFMLPFIFFALINIFSEGTWGWLVFAMPHFWIGLVLAFGIPIYLILVHKHVHYAITNKRVLYQRGLIGRDFETVDFDQITNLEVNMGVVDKIFGGNSASIYVSTANIRTVSGSVISKYTLKNIKEPYEVFKHLKKVSHAVKTDIYYPNKLRPKSNPGYKTSYKGKFKSSYR